MSLSREETSKKKKVGLQVVRNERYEVLTSQLFEEKPGEGFKMKVALQIKKEKKINTRDADVKKRDEWKRDLCMIS